MQQKLNWNGTAFTPQGDWYEPILLGIHNWIDRFMSSESPGDSPGPGQMMSEGYDNPGHGLDVGSTGGGFMMGATAIGKRGLGPDYDPTMPNPVPGGGGTRVESKGAWQCQGKQAFS